MHQGRKIKMHLFKEAVLYYSMNRNQYYKYGEKDG